MATSDTPAADHSSVTIAVTVTLTLTPGAIERLEAEQGSDVNPELLVRWLAADAAQMPTVRLAGAGATVTTELRS